MRRSRRPARCRAPTLAEPWVNADIRISFAKNKTHAEFGFALCVHNLLGALPLRDRAYHYRARLKPWDTCVDLLRATPVHVAIVDAIVSNHGSLGDRSPRPLANRHDHRRTRTQSWSTSWRPRR